MIKLSGTEKAALLSPIIDNRFETNQQINGLSY